jgi:hypothetical protein
MTQRELNRLVARSPARRAVLAIAKAYRQYGHGAVAEAYLVRSFAACHRFPASTTRAAVAFLGAVGAIVPVGWRRTAKGGRTKLWRAT